MWTKRIYVAGNAHMFAHLHFHHVKCEARHGFTVPMCHRLQAVNISVQWSCIWRQLRSWVRLTGLLRASAQESLQYLIAFFFSLQLPPLLKHVRFNPHFCSSKRSLRVSCFKLCRCFQFSCVLHILCWIGFALCFVRPTILWLKLSQRDVRIFMINLIAGKMT